MRSFLSAGRLRWSQFAVLCGVGLWWIFSPPQRLPHVDDVAESYFEETITKAGIAYGTARLINAGVSVVKESSLHLEPGGMGVAIAVGQVADPLDDMTERLSTMLVTAIVSLLVQRICFEIAQAYVFRLLGITLLGMALMSLVPGSRLVALRSLALRVSLLLVIVRMFLPASALMSDFLNQNLFFPKIDRYHQSLIPVTSEFVDITEFDMPQIGSIRDAFTKPMEALSTKAAQLKRAASRTLYYVAKEGMEIFNTMLKITALYLGVFLVQVLFIPLAMFWLLNKILFVLFGYQIPLPVRPRMSGVQPSG